MRLRAKDPERRRFTSTKPESSSSELKFRVPNGSGLKTLLEEPGEVVVGFEQKTEFSLGRWDNLIRKVGTQAIDGEARRTEIEVKKAGYLMQALARIAGVYPNRIIVRQFREALPISEDAGTLR